MYLRCILLVLTTLTAITSFGQVTVRGAFLPDSVIIGDEASFYLTATYPRKLQVIFPDSTYNFAPFEFVKKKYFTTTTSDSISYDSAVYTLSTFEVDPIQTLQLSAFVLHQQDCTAFSTKTDTVFLKELVTIPLPDTLKAENLPLISNTAYEPVNWLLNYPLLLYIGGGLLVLLAVLWLIFGKRIRKHFTAKRLIKEHEFFINSFDHHYQTLKQTFNPKQAEQLLFLWKKYMESLDRKPYTKLTSKETERLLQNQSLGLQLRLVDASVYGNNQEIDQPVAYLRQHAMNTFQQKLEQVKHG
jgi:hypothetical protein